MRDLSEPNARHSLLLVVAFLCATVAAGLLAARDVDHKPVPILVELFTSQGCSSCPPADRLLSDLAASDPDVVTLSFHVDYWNSIGWIDPYSSPDWSQRQRRYARSLGADHVYTPQLVVNGRRHGVGSDSSEVAELLRQARHDNSATTLSLDTTRLAQHLAVKIDADLPRDLAANSLGVWVALVEDGLETAVSRGENARRTLHNDRVVRRLVAASTPQGDSNHYTATVELTLSEEWRTERLSVAVFLQDSRTLQVYAAAASDL